MHVIEGGSEGGVERCKRTVSGANVPAKEPHGCSTIHSVGFVVNVQSGTFQCLPDPLIPGYERGVIATSERNDGSRCMGLLRIQCLKQAEYLVKRRHTCR